MICEVSIARIAAVDEIEDSITTMDSGREPYRLPTPSREDIGWLLVGGGIVGSLVTLLRRRRRVADWFLHLGLICGGAGVLLQRRRKHMDQAQESIMAELDNLDPIARAQVLKAVAERQLGRGKD